MKVRTNLHKDSLIALTPLHLRSTQTPVLACDIVLLPSHPLPNHTRKHLQCENGFSGVEGDRHENASQRQHHLEGDVIFIVVLIIFPREIFANPAHISQGSCCSAPHAALNSLILEICRKSGTRTKMLFRSCAGQAPGGTHYLLATWETAGPFLPGFFFFLLLSTW